MLHAKCFHFYFSMSFLLICTFERLNGNIWSSSLLYTKCFTFTWINNIWTVFNLACVIHCISSMSSVQQICLVYFIPLWKNCVFIDFHQINVTHYKNTQTTPSLHGLKPTFHSLYFRAQIWIMYLRFKTDLSIWSNDGY